MAVRYRLLAAYSALLAALAAAWLAHGLDASPGLPPAWAVALCIAASLAVWQFGVPAPRVGLASMERLPQIGLLLVLDPATAAAICGAASLVWPLINRRYSQGSLRVAALRGVHNAAMTALMLLLAGNTYLALGGEHPLTSPGIGDLVPLVAMALVAQAVNVALLAMYFWLDRRNVRHLIKPIYSLIDLMFVPAGVLAAILFNSAPPSVFALFTLLMAIFVLSFNRLDRTAGARRAVQPPLVNLASTRTSLYGARRLDELASRIRTEVASLFRFDELTLCLLDAETGMLEVRLHDKSGRRLHDGKCPLSTGLVGWMVERQEALLIEDWARAPDALRQDTGAAGQETGSLIAVPLIEDGIVIGILSVHHLEPGTWSDADLHLMRQVAAQVSAAVADARAFEDLESYRKDLEQRVAERTAELERANNEKERLIAALRERSRLLERETQEDPLTGIANRRHFAQRLDDELRVASSVGQALTLAVADLDRFKVINDRLGHAVGDEVLRQCAKLMRALCRSTDLVARIGGEEFALILPGMPREAAVAFCESVRRTVESHDWAKINAELRVTLSIGLYQWDGSGATVELLRQADARLYSAKRAGRNRVA